MKKVVNLSIGNGDLTSGFPNVMLQIREADSSKPPLRFGGQLPAAPEIIDTYQKW